LEGVSGRVEIKTRDDIYEVKIALKSTELIDKKLLFSVQISESMHDGTRRKVLKTALSLLPRVVWKWTQLKSGS
jgi:hypothetical protein